MQQAGARGTTHEVVQLTGHRLRVRSTQVYIHIVPNLEPRGEISSPATQLLLLRGPYARTTAGTCSSPAGAQPPGPETLPKAPLKPALPLRDS